MKRRKQFTFFILATLLQVPLAACAAESGLAMPLSAAWRFRLDPKAEGLAAEWFNQKLPDTIELPGSCEQRGYGEKPGQPEDRRLTHVLKYVGPAWYQRELVIPPQWTGKRAELFLERCHWETTLWIDGKRIGMQNSLSVPHLHDLGCLTPGTHTLTICVDNTYKLRIGTWGNSITEDTQGNWNGIIGVIALRATDPVWIRSAQIFPGKIKVSVGNQTGQELAGKIAGSEIKIPAGGGELEIHFSRSLTEQKWDEFSPKLHTLDLKLTAGKFSDLKNITYGVRDLTIKDKQFLVNDRTVLLRGSLDCCVYPLTGYPPMDKAGWLRVMGICKSYGFNFMRFHSWCPPEAAFAAADDLGFMFQVEVPVWTMDAPAFGEDAPRDQFIRDELARILETYGNHPSFALMAMGNESGGTLDTLVKFGRAKDSRRLYRCENGERLADGDYFETGQRGILGPRTDWDRWSMPPGWIVGKDVGARPDVPMLAHEVGQWSMYPNLDGANKYTGTLRQLNFARFRESLAARHLLDQAKDFAEASGKFSIQLYKDEIEGSFRTWPFGGFDILDAHDYPGQGAGLVGWLDAFWDSKGLIKPEEFRRFCGPTVCLLRMPKRLLTTADTFTAVAQISHFGPRNLPAEPEWSITDERGKRIAKGKLPPLTLETGRVTTIGELKAALADVAAPARLLVTLGAAGTMNTWNIWVYPANQPPPPPNVRIAHSFDQATRDALAVGERVLLFSSPKEGLIVPPNAFFGPDNLRVMPPAQPGMNAVIGSFMPTFWNMRLFNQIGTLGLLCDPKHPALAEFPTEKHSDWQWADLLGRFSAAYSFEVAGAPKSYADALANYAGDVINRSKAIVLDETPPDFRPIVQVIDNYERNSKLGSIFETRVGAGKLFVCALDLDTDLAKRPAARQLRKSLLDYVASAKFAPRHERSLELLKNILTTSP